MIKKSCDKTPVYNLHSDPTSEPTDVSNQGVLRSTRRSLADAENQKQAGHARILKEGLKTVWGSPLWRLCWQRSQDGWKTRPVPLWVARKENKKYPATLVQGRHGIIYEETCWIRPKAHLVQRSVLTATGEMLKGNSTAQQNPPCLPPQTTRMQKHTSLAAKVEHSHCKPQYCHTHIHGVNQNN